MNALAPNMASVCEYSANATPSNGVAANTAPMHSLVRAWSNRLVQRAHFPSESRMRIQIARANP